MSRDPLPRPVWEDNKIFSFPDRSGRIKVYIPSQTSLGRVKILSVPDQSGRLNIYAASQTSIGIKEKIQLARSVWEVES